MNAHHEQITAAAVAEVLRLSRRSAARAPTASDKEEPSTVFASIVAVCRSKEGQMTYRVLSVGSGCRSVGHRKVITEFKKSIGSERDISAFIHAYVLHDSHAEVMARRAFVAYALSEMEEQTQMLTTQLEGGRSIGHEVEALRDKLANGDSEFILEPVYSDGSIQFMLRKVIEGIYLWSSQPMCGDCTIVLDMDGVALAGTGAHVLVNEAERDRYHALTAKDTLAQPDSTNTIAADEANIAGHFCGCNNAAAATKCPWSPSHEEQGTCGYPYQQTATGFCRTKPGAGVPTLSMSCSDKVGRWLREGLGGRAMSRLLTHGLPLNGVVVLDTGKGTSDQQCQSLARGLRCPSSQCAVSGPLEAIPSGVPSTSSMWQPRSDEVVALNTKLGIPMGATTTMVSRCFKANRCKRPRDEVEPSEQPTMIASTSIPMSAFPAVLAHFGCRYTIANRTAALIRTVDVLGGTVKATPTTYKELKGERGDQPLNVPRLTKAADRDFDLSEPSCKHLYSA